MGNREVEVINVTNVVQGVGAYDFEPGKPTPVPYDMAAQLAVQDEFRVDSSELVADFPFACVDGTCLGWSSPFHYADGYGSVAQEIARTFIEQAGVHLTVVPRDYDPADSRFGNYPVERWADEAFVPQSIVDRLLSDQEAPLYGINMTWPLSVHMSKFPRTIGYTMFETTHPPLEWAESMNRCRRIITPCAQNKEAFERIGVTVPIDVVNLGVDPEKWPYVDRSKRDYRQRPFIFLMAGGITFRKNPQAAVRAFLDAFPDEPGVRLAIKTRGEQASGGFHAWLEDVPKDDRVLVIKEESAPERMVSFFHDADAFVFPSRGEGFGLPPLQAMSTGLPTIVAANSGMLEYSDPKWCYPVKCEQVPVPDNEHGGFPDEWGYCGEWWEVDHDALVAAYQKVYSNPKAAFKKGLRATQIVRDNYTVRQTCEGILRSVEADWRDST